MSVRVTTAGQIACGGHDFGSGRVLHESRSRRAKLVAVATKRGSGLGRVCQRQSPCVVYLDHSLQCLTGETRWGALGMSQIAMTVACRC